MLRTSANLMSQSIVSLRTGQPIGLAIEPIINPHNLKILGWWCRTPQQKSGLVLLAEDVRDVIPQGFAVNDEDTLSPVQDLVRHDKILESNFQLVDKPVKTKGHKLGRINDYAYDEGLFIQKLYVTRSLTKIFASEDTLIIGRNQIIEVSDKYVLVKDTEIHADGEELAGAPEAAAS